MEYTSTVFHSSIVVANATTHHRTVRGRISGGGVGQGQLFKMSCMLNLSFFTYGKDASLATLNGDNYVLYSIINILVAALV